MPFFSVAYHDSLRYSRRSAGDPVTLHWETRMPPDKRFAGAKRYSVSKNHTKALDGDLFSLVGEPSSMLNRVFSQLKNDVCADGLRSVGVYALLQGQNIPDGLYYFDPTSDELVELPAGGSAPSASSGTLSPTNAKARRANIETLKDAFPPNEIMQTAGITLFFTGILDRIVWRYKEAAYRELQLDAGSYAGLVAILARSLGGIAIPFSAFVDDEVAVALSLSPSEVPLAALCIMPKALKKYETVSEFAYSNRTEMHPVSSEGANRYIARFMLQNRVECITDLSHCMKVCRVVASPFKGEEFPLTPLKFPNEYFFREYEFLGPGAVSFRNFKPWKASLDDFSTVLRWMEICNLNAFGAGLLKIWVLSFDVQLVYPGLYRYLPVKKSLFLQTNFSDRKKFAGAHLCDDSVENVSFAVIFTADLEEACNMLGERAYRYLNMNAGYVAEILRESARGLGKFARREPFFCEAELKKALRIPESESVLSEVLVGR
ncbi:nitroreductase family protein [Fibrobacter sp.]